MQDRIRKLKKAFRNCPNLLKGYNIYTDRRKFKLIRHAFENQLTDAATFADLGGVWKVNAAYTVFTLKNFSIERGVIVDINFNKKTEKKLSKYDNLITIRGDFGSDAIISQIGAVDVIYFFDVLLHQVDPDWDRVLERYAEISNCFVIFNQQYVGSDHAIRLTDLPLEEYRTIVPRRKDDLCDYIYRHKNQIHPEYNKRWKDIHNIWQWGITDLDLRRRMNSLGYKETYYRDYGRFSNLEFFEDHAFIFLRT